MFWRLIMRNDDHIATMYSTQRKNLERVAALKVGTGDAPDVVQDVFTKLWARNLPGQTLSVAYIYRATVYMAISHFRSTRRHKIASEKLALICEDHALTTSDDLISQRLRVERVRSSLDRIPERARAIFLLNRLHGCTYDEIALAMQISYRTVEREIAMAIAACKIK